MMRTLVDLVALSEILLVLLIVVAFIGRVIVRLEAQRAAFRQQQLTEQCRHATRAEELERQRIALAKDAQEYAERQRQLDAKRAEQRAAVEERLRDRVLVIDERRIAIEEKLADTRVANAQPTTSAPKVEPELPADLQLRVSGWEDSWARDQERRVILELYEECGRAWDRVRLALLERDGRADSSDLAILN